MTDFVFVGTRVLSSKLSSPKLLVVPALTRNLSRRDSSMLMTATREIKNLDAFKLFHDYFLKSAHDEFKLYALECVTQIYASHPNNFRIVEEFHLLSHLLQAVAASAPSVRVRELHCAARYSTDDRAGGDHESARVRRDEWTQLRGLPRARGPQLSLARYVVTRVRAVLTSAQSIPWWRCVAPCSRRWRG